MQRQQLKFWPTVQDAPHRPPLWETLMADERGKIIALLARLITAAVSPEEDKATQENEHEP